MDLPRRYTLLRVGTLQAGVKWIENDSRRADHFARGPTSVHNKGRAVGDHPTERRTLAGDPGDAACKGYGPEGKGWFGPMGRPAAEPAMAGCENKNVNKVLKKESR